jgi:hypothetical protein
MGTDQTEAIRLGWKFFQKETEETEKTFPRMTRMNADKINEPI